jgi:excisionase family DNA binding protein
VGLSVEDPKLPHPSDWLTPREAAALLRVPEDALQRAARRGTVPCLRIGREFRFSGAALADAAVAPVATTAAAAPQEPAPRDPTNPPNPLRPGAGLSRRASEAARKRVEASRQAIKACTDLVASLADERRRDAERTPQDNARAWRWVAHRRPDLEAIAHRHALEFRELVSAAHRRVRWKRVDLPEAIVADLNQLIEQHSLYDAWSAEPPPETFPTRVTVAIRPDEEASFVLHARTKERGLTLSPDFAGRLL